MNSSLRLQRTLPAGTRTLMVIVLFLISVQDSFATEIISKNSTWKYWDTGSGISSSWKDLGFNDSSWPSGAGQLGYGDGDEATVVSYGSNANNKYPTTYFRHTFSVADSSAWSDLDIDLMRDDGAVIYINGNEVWRSNMPSGTISYGTYAAATVGGSDEDTYYSQNVANSLVNGTNVIAVEIHNRSATSSDISFDLALIGNAAPADPPYVSYGADWKYLDDGSDQGTAWQAPGFNDGSWASGPAELGYGDGDENTVVDFGGNSNNKYITTYFRHTFNATGFSASDFIELRLKRDDGAVVYLNGSEVMRDGMPSGAISYNTLASSTQGGSAESTPVTQLVPATLLNDGSNTIAVEIHQAAINSSDITLDLEVQNIGSATATLVRGPYLQTLSQNSVIVKWRTDFPTTSMVRYGLTMGVPTDSAVDLTVSTEHEVSISGLSPDTKYFYSFGDVGSDLAGGDAGHFIWTAPVSEDNSLTRTWVLGDCGTANSDQRAVRDAYYSYVGASRTDQILLLGDNAYNDGTDAQYQNAIFENMYESILRNTVMWSCPGNHDLHSANSASQTGPYYEIFTFPKAAEAGGVASGTEAYYSWDYGQIHFISLDSEDTDRSVGSPQLTWLTNDLAATTKPWIVVIFHHPPYTKGSHDSDNTGDSGGRMRDMRENVLPILESYGVDLVLSGHSHSYERSYFIKGHYDVSSTFNNSMKVQDGDGQLDGDCSYLKTSAVGDGAVYITAGSSGKVTGTLTHHNAMYAYLYQRGSVIVEVEGNRMDVKFLNESGSETDYFTIDKDILNASVDTTINAGDSITLTASWMDDFSWSPGGASTRSITVSPAADTQYVVTNGCVSDTFNVTVIAGCGSPQMIGVDPGWNIVSSFSAPSNPDMLSVISGHESDILVIKDINGNVVLPSLSLNQIGNWSVDEAYKIKASNPFSLDMGCSQVDPVSTPISLGSGWSLIAYLRDDPMDAVTALAGISSEIIIVKNEDGQIYIPAFSLNQIGNLIPGQGYFIKMANPATLTYPANTAQ